MTDTRPGWDEYFIRLAEAASLRADCTRRRVGAVIVKDNRVVSMGYNGAPAGQPGCLSDGACPRGRHYKKWHQGLGPDWFCACDNPWPCPDAVEPGSSYDNCISSHAEENALLYSSRDQNKGATIYITDEPCFRCWKLIASSGIRRVVYPNGDFETLPRLRQIYAERSPQS